MTAVRTCASLGLQPSSQEEASKLSSINLLEAVGFFFLESQAPNGERQVVLYVCVFGVVLVKKKGNVGWQRLHAWMRACDSTVQGAPLRASFPLKIVDARTLF